MKREFFNYESNFVSLVEIWYGFYIKLFKLYYKMCMCYCVLLEYY